MPDDYKNGSYLAAPTVRPGGFDIFQGLSGPTPRHVGTFIGGTPRNGEQCEADARAIVDALAAAEKG